MYATFPWEDPPAGGTPSLPPRQLSAHKSAGNMKTYVGDWF